MQDVNFGGILTGVIVTVICGAFLSGFKAYRKWQLKEDIATLEFERKHLEEIKRSSVAMNRSAFRGVFFILACICLAQLAAIWTDLLSIAEGYKEGIVSAFWFTGAWGGFNLFRRYGRLADYQLAISKIDGKLEKLIHKQQNI